MKESGPENFFERKKGELEKNEAEKGQKRKGKFGREGKGRKLAEERKEDQQTREDEREFLRYLIQDTGDEIIPTMSEVTVAPGHDATAIKAMIVAAAVEEIDRGETTTQAMVVETMIVAATRQHENVVAAIRLRQWRQLEKTGK